MKAAQDITHETLSSCLVKEPLIDSWTEHARRIGTRRSLMAILRQDWQRSDPCRTRFSRILSQVRSRQHGWKATEVEKTPGGSLVSRKYSIGGYSRATIDLSFSRHSVFSLQQQRTSAHGANNPKSAFDVDGMECFRIRREERISVKIRF